MTPAPQEKLPVPSVKIMYFNPIMGILWVLFGAFMLNMAISTLQLKNYAYAKSDGEFFALLATPLVTGLAMVLASYTFFFRRKAPGAWAYAQRMQRLVLASHVTPYLYTLFIMAMGERSSGGDWGRGGSDAPCFLFVATVFAIPHLIVSIKIYLKLKRPEMAGWFEADAPVAGLKA